LYILDGFADEIAC